MCRGRDTNRFTLCVASHQIARIVRRFAPHISTYVPLERTNILASWIRHVRSSPSPRGPFRNRVRHVRRFWDPMWATTTASQAEYAMCVASCPHVGHPSNMWAIKREKARADSALCVASHTNDPCVFPSGHGLQRAARSPSAGERDGEHARAAVVNAEGD